MASDTKALELDLTELEAYYLNAAVCEFFHKMRAAIEGEGDVTFIDDERYEAAKSLWDKVEAQVPVA